MDTEKPLREQLADALFSHTPWDALQNHFDRDAVFLIHGVDLIDVGEALATNATSKVADWIATGALRRPDASDARAFEADKTVFQSLIVQPWVLIAVMVVD